MQKIDNGVRETGGLREELDILKPIFEEYTKEYYPGLKEQADVFEPVTDENEENNPKAK